MVLSEQVLEGQSGSLEQDVDIVGAQVFFIFGNIVDKLLENLTQLLTKPCDLFLCQLNDSVQAAHGIKILLLAEKVAQVS